LNQSDPHSRNTERGTGEGKDGSAEWTIGVKEEGPPAVVTINGSIVASRETPKTQIPGNWGGQPLWCAPREGGGAGKKHPKCEEGGISQTVLLKIQEKN